MKKTPPRGLCASARRVWVAVFERYRLEQHHAQILLEALKSLTRAEEAKALLDRDGCVFVDRFGQPRPHPATVVERDCRAAFIKGITALGLDIE